MALHDSLSVTLWFGSLTVIFYTLYWIIAQSGRIRRRFYAFNDHDTASVKHVSFKRVTGFLLLGLLPLAISLTFIEGFTLEDAGLAFNRETSRFTFISIAALSALTIPVLSLTARKPSILANYPQIRASKWTIKTLLIEALTWALYLFGYETLFRGLLLLPAASSAGPFAAILINVVLYAGAHIPKGKTETFASIPFGIVLCLLTLHSGTIWIAFFAHLVNALTVSFTALRFNPEIKYAGMKISN